MNHDLGMLINSATEKLGQRLEFKMGTISTGHKMELAGSQPLGLRTSHPMMKRASPEDSMLKHWGTQIKHCTSVGGRDCPRFIRIATSLAARIGKKK